MLSAKFRLKPLAYIYIYTTRERERFDTISRRRRELRKFDQEKIQLTPRNIFVSVTLSKRVFLSLFCLFVVAGFFSVCVSVCLSCLLLLFRV